jgi:bifunctional DNA-binding transcriptional regulator/antitoxin component of YhaV-PrlF toxin-antitoxin module
MAGGKKRQGPTKVTPTEPRKGPERGWRRVAEIGAPYLVLEDEDAAAVRGTTRLSSKNQLTLPVAMVRRLGLEPGDELDLTVVGDAVRIERRPRTPQEWLDRLSGSLSHIPEWQTDEDIDAYVRRERDSWE